MNIRRKIHNLLHPKVGEIWMLHRVVEQRSKNPEQRVLEVTPDWLEQKILEYRKKGYAFVSIDDVSQFQVSGFRFQRFVCLTLDDGYRDNYTLARPLFERLGIPFVVYVTTGFIDNRREMWWYMGERLGIGTEELKQLDADPLCTIGAHTVSHPKLDTLSYEEQYKEIADSKQHLEQLLGHPVHHFSFPHGAYNADTLAICRELGFKTVVQSWGGPVRRNMKYDVLPRINPIQYD